MRESARLVFVLFILFSLWVSVRVVVGEDAKPTKPHMTAEQKLAIRTAQVEMFQAKSVLEATPQYKAFVEAQDRMNQLALAIQRQVNADPAKWQLSQDLEYVAVPETKPSAPEKK